MSTTGKMTRILCACGNQFTVDNPATRRLRQQRDAARKEAAEAMTELGDMQRRLHQSQEKARDLTAQIQRQAEQIIAERVSRTPPQG